MNGPTNILLWRLLFPNSGKGKLLNNLHMPELHLSEVFVPSRDPMATLQTNGS